MFGPPNSGKGTYGKRVASILNMPYISSGDLVRQQLSEDESWFKGLYSWALYNRGEFVPFDLMCALIKEHIEASNGCCVIDGFPRDAAQLVEFEKWNIDFILISIEHNDDVLIDRAVRRMQCVQCGEICSRGNPNMEVGPGDSCLKCGGDVRRRGDDNEEVVRARLTKYKDSTLPILNRCSIWSLAVIKYSPEGSDVDTLSQQLSEMVIQRWEEI